MLHPVRFGGFGQPPVKSPAQARLSFSGVKRKAETPPFPIDEIKLRKDTNALMLNSAEAAETIGTPVYRNMVHRFLKALGAPRLSRQMQGSSPLFGPKTLEQHVEQMVHLLSRVAHIPIPNQLNQNRLTLNEAFRKDHPFLAHGVLKHLNGKTGVAELNQTDRYGLTAFYTAVLTGHLPEAKMILEKGADPFIPDKNGKSALDLLVDQGEVEQLDSLLEKAKLDSAQKEKAQALQKEAKLNQIARSHYLRHYETLSPAEKQAEMFQIVGSDVEPVHEYERQMRLVALLKAGANPNAQVNGTGDTALHLVAQKGRANLLPVLLKAGADVNATDSHGNTPLNSAVCRNKNNMVSMLLQAGADVNVANGSGNTPLILASYYSYGKVVRSLLQEGAKVNVENILGETPLHMIAHSENGFSDVVHALLNAGASIEVRDWQGDRPMDRAVAREHDNVIRILNEAILNKSQPQKTG